jgi:hypothetical protein
MRVQVRLEGETVLHRPQEKDTGEVEVCNGRMHRHGTRGDDQPIIPKLACQPIAVSHDDEVAGRVDGLSRVVKKQVNAFTGNVFSRPMGQPVPIGHFAREVERETTDAIVGEAISQDDHHIHCRIHLFGS